MTSELICGWAQGGCFHFTLLGEALGAIGNPEVLEVLKQYSADPVIEVAETCQLAVRRLEWLQQHSGEPAVAGPYLSVDPAPPAEERDVGRLREVLLDEGQPLFDRYPRLHVRPARRRLRGGCPCAAEGLRCGGASSATRSAMSLASGSTMAAVPQLAADPGPAQPRSPMGGSECAEDLGAIARPRLPLAALRGPLGPTPTPWCGESCEVPWTCTTTETGPAFQYRGRGWEQLRNGARLEPPARGLPPPAGPWDATPAAAYQTELVWVGSWLPRPPGARLSASCVPRSRGAAAPQISGRGWRSRGAGI
ncbi:deoxyhypusine hydroxylase isoform X2 [Lynx canadensis]|uniref:deoxyhypusine hydroxylase isoform X2 n=1 Tax=Lynx canadensis TaxID=61383 RepID=UPI0011B0E007|nr:deoxyhypusine hydroxylase isoform X2 [Lynx canadensis]